MSLEKIEELKKERDKYKKKLAQMESDYAETKAGSRYGVEYLDIQIKVYTKMIGDIEEEIRKERVKK